MGTLSISEISLDGEGDYVHTVPDLPFHAATLAVMRDLVGTSTPEFIIEVMDVWLEHSGAESFQVERKETDGTIYRWEYDVFPWSSDPIDALWFGQIIVGTEDDTDYFYGYSVNRDDLPDVDLLCPDGWEILERTLKLTPRGFTELPGWVGDQIIPESDSE